MAVYQATGQKPQCDKMMFTSRFGFGVVIQCVEGRAKSHMCNASMYDVPCTISVENAGDCGG